MKLYTTILLLVMSLLAWSQPSETLTHKVKPGETKYGISRQYSISIETLEKYNPDVAQGLKTGMMLLIPTPDEAKLKPEDESPSPAANHQIHRVTAGETLYSLARKYGVSIAEVEKLNPELKQGGLKEGMVLLFPKEKVVVEAMTQRDSSYYWHEVKEGETAWSISRNYKITLDSLYTLNPEVELGIRLGQYLRLPLNRTPNRKPAKDELASDKEYPELPDDGRKLADTSDGYILYPVKAGDTFYSLKQRFLTSQEELVKINPELSTGLKLDKYILIPYKKEEVPNNFFDRVFKNTEVTGPTTDPDLHQYQTRDSLNQKAEDRVVDLPKEDTLKVDLTKSYKVAILLPFYANSDINKFENGINPKSSIALDFYNAFLLAADTLVKQGMNLELVVYDTENNPTKTKRIAAELKVSPPDLIIGPLFKRNVELVAQSMQETGVKVISPLSNTVETAGMDNLIKCVPSASAIAEEYARTINHHYAADNLIFLDYPGKNGIGQTQEISEVIARIKPLQGQQKITRLQVRSKDGDLKLDSLLDYSIKDSALNVIVSLSEDGIFLSTLVGELRRGSSRDSTKIRLLVPPKVMDINTLDINYLNDLQVTMPNNNFVNYRDINTQAFISKYRKSYAHEPTKYAYQGYDVGMFFLQKMWRTGPFFPQTIQAEQRLLSTGFRIVPAQGGGYENRYLLTTGIRNFELIQLD